jgi:hypothetical protein
VDNEAMRPAMKRALICGAVPVLALVAALPFVNRLRPVVFGLPFGLFWILAWVGLTPVFLFLADRFLRKERNDKDGER